jgi:hypothetical protein
MLTRRRFKKGTYKRGLFEAMLMCEGLADGTEQPMQYSLGLCHHVLKCMCERADVISGTKQRASVCAELDLAFMSWVKFSGSIGFPVPGEGEESPGTTYYNRPNLWDESEYGNNRRDLCRHVAAAFRKILEGNKA